MSESTIPSTPKQIAEQINREAGIANAPETAGELTRDPIVTWPPPSITRLFDLRIRRGAELPYFEHLPLAYMTSNARTDGPFKEHRWTGVDAMLMAEFYRLGERDWVVILWPRTADHMLAGKYLGKGKTVQQAYRAAYRDQRLSKYSKGVLLRLANHAEKVGPLQRRNERLRTLATAYRARRDNLDTMVDFLEKCLQQAEKQLRELRSDDHVQDLRIKLDAALSKIDMLEKPGQGQPGIARPNVDVIITRAEYVKLLEKADQEVATAQKGAEWRRRATAAEALVKQYREQIARMEGQPATAGATS